MKQLRIPVSKWCPCVGVSHCSLSVPSGFGGRTGSEGSMDHVFPQGVLAAITVVGGGEVEMEELEPEPVVS